MATFELAVRKVFALEGEHSNDPADPGGDTWYGITKRDHPDIPWPPDLEQAKAIYHANYWHPLWDKLASEEVAAELLDYAVVAGPKTATLLAQRALNRLGWKLDEDGVFGVYTLDALNITTEESFLMEYRTEQIVRAVKLGEERPQLKKFLRGWIRRALL